MSPKGQHFFGAPGTRLFACICASVFLALPLAASAQDSSVSGCGGKGVFSIECTGDIYCNGKKYQKEFYLNDKCETPGKNEKATKTGIIGKSCVVKGPTNSFGGGTCCQKALCSNPQTQDGKPLDKTQEQLAKDLRGGNLDPQPPPSSSGLPGSKTGEQPTPVQELLQRYGEPQQDGAPPSINFDDLKDNPAFLKDLSQTGIPVEYVTDPKTGEVTISPNTIKALENLAAPENIGSLQPLGPPSEADGRPSLWESALFNDGNTFGGEGLPESEGEKSVWDKARDLANDLWGKVTDFAGGVACGVGSAVGVGSCGAPLAAETPQTVGENLPPAFETPPQTIEGIVKNLELEKEFAPQLDGLITRDVAESLRDASTAAEKQLRDFVQENIRLDKEGNLVEPLTRAQQREYQELVKEAEERRQEYNDYVKESAGADFTNEDVRRALLRDGVDTPGIKEPSQLTAEQRAEGEQMLKQIDESLKEYLPTDKSLAEIQQNLRALQERGLITQDQIQSVLDKHGIAQVGQGPLTKLLAPTDSIEAFQKEITPLRAEYAAIQNLAGENYGAYESIVAKNLSSSELEASVNDYNKDYRPAVYDYAKERESVARASLAEARQELAEHRAQQPWIGPSRPVDVYRTDEYGNRTYVGTEDFRTAESRTLNQIQSLESEIKRYEKLAQYMDYRPASERVAAYVGVDDIAVRNQAEVNKDSYSRDVARYIAETPDTPEGNVRRELLLRQVENYETVSREFEIAQQRFDSRSPAQQRDLAAQFNAQREILAGQLDRIGTDIAALTGVSPEGLSPELANLERRMLGNETTWEQFRNWTHDKLSGYAGDNATLRNLFTDPARAIGGALVGSVELVTRITDPFTGVSPLAVELSRLGLSEAQMNLTGLYDLGNVGLGAADILSFGTPTGARLANEAFDAARSVTQGQKFSLADTVVTNPPAERLAPRDIGGGAVPHVGDTPVGPVFSKDPLPNISQTSVSAAQKEVIDGLGTRLSAADHQALADVGLSTQPYGNVVAEVTTKAGRETESIIVQRTAIVDANGEVVAVRSRATGSDAAKIDAMTSFELVRPTENPGLFASARDRFSNWWNRTDDAAPLESAAAPASRPAASARNETLDGTVTRGTSGEQRGPAQLTYEAPQSGAAPRTGVEPPGDSPRPTPPLAGTPDVPKSQPSVAPQAGSDPLFREIADIYRGAQLPPDTLRSPIASGEGFAAPNPAPARTPSPSVSTPDRTTADPSPSGAPARSNTTIVSESRPPVPTPAPASQAARPVAERPQTPTPQAAPSPQVQQFNDLVAQYRAAIDEANRLSSVIAKTDSAAVQRTATGLRNDSLERAGTAQKEIYDLVPAVDGLSAGDRKIDALKAFVGRGDAQSAEVMLNEIAGTSYQRPPQIRLARETPAPVASSPTPRPAAQAPAPAAPVRPDTSGVTPEPSTPVASPQARIAINTPAPISEKIATPNGGSTELVVQKIDTPLDGDKVAIGSRGAAKRDTSGTSKSDDEVLALYRVDERGSVTVSVVFDGVGGSGKGDVAAQTAKTEFEYVLKSIPTNATEAQVREALTRAFQEANVAVNEGNTDLPPGQKGYTVASAFVLVERLGQSPVAVVAHIGDARVGRLRGNDFEYVTTDNFRPDRDPARQKAIQDALDRVGTVEDIPALQSELARRGYQVDLELVYETRNQVSGYIGDARGTGSLTVQNVEARPGDIFIATTDGIHDPFTRDQVGSIAARATSLQGITEGLVQGAFHVSGRPGDTRIAQLVNDIGVTPGQMSPRIGRAKVDDASVAVARVSPIRESPSRLASSPERPAAQAPAQARAPRPITSVVGSGLGGLTNFFEGGFSNGLTSLARYVVTGRAPSAPTPAIDPLSDQGIISNLKAQGARRGYRIEVEAGRSVSTEEVANVPNLSRAESRTIPITDAMNEMREEARMWLQRPRITIQHTKTGSVPSVSELLEFRYALEAQHPTLNALNEANKLRMSPISGFYSKLQSIAGAVSHLDSPEALAIQRLNASLPPVTSRGQYDGMSLSQKVELSRKIDSAAETYLSIMTGIIPEIPAVAVVGSSVLPRRTISNAEVNVLDALTKRAGRNLDNDFLSKEWIAPGVTGSRKDIVGALARGSVEEQALVKSAAEGDTAGLVAALDSRYVAPSLAGRFLNRLSDSSVGRWIRGALTGTVIAFGAMTELPARNALSQAVGLGPQGIAIARTVEAPGVSSRSLVRDQEALTKLFSDIGLQNVRPSIGPWITGSRVSTYGYQGDAAGNIITASGARRDNNLFSVAHKTLPIGTIIQIEHVTNGRTFEAVAVVNNRGPYVAGRDLDLVPALSRALGLSGDANSGAPIMRYRVIGKPAGVPAYSGPTTANRNISPRTDYVAGLQPTQSTRIVTTLSSPPAATVAEVPRTPPRAPETTPPTRPATTPVTVKEDSRTTAETAKEIFSTLRKGIQDAGTTPRETTTPRVQSVTVASPVALPRVNEGPRIDFNVSLEEVYRQSKVRFGKHPGTDKYPWSKYSAEQRAQAVAYQTNNPGGMKWPFIFELMGQPGKPGPYAGLFNVARIGPDGQVVAESVHPGKINIIPSRTPFVTFASFSDAVGAMAAKAAYQQAYRNLNTFDDMIRTWVAKDNVSPYLDAGSYANQARVSGDTRLVRDSNNRLEIAQMATIAKGIPLAEYSKLFQKANVVDPITKKPVATAEDLLTPEVLRDGLMKIYSSAEADGWYRQVTGKDVATLATVKVAEKPSVKVTEQKTIPAPKPAPRSSLAREINSDARAQRRAAEEAGGALSPNDDIVRRTLAGIVKSQTTKPGLDRMPDLVKWLRTVDGETAAIARAVFEGRTGARIDKDGWISLPKETQEALLKVGVEFEVRPWEGRPHKGVARPNGDRYIVQHEFRNQGGAKDLERTIASHQRGGRGGAYVDFYVSEPVERLSDGKVGVKVVQIKPVWEYSAHAKVRGNHAGVGIEHAKNANDSFKELELIAGAVLTDALKNWKQGLEVVPHWPGGTEGAGIATFLNKREVRLAAAPDPATDARRFAAAIGRKIQQVQLAESVEWHKVTIYGPESLTNVQFNFDGSLTVVPDTVAVLAPSQTTPPPGETNVVDTGTVAPPTSPRAAEEGSLRRLAEEQSKTAPQDMRVAQAPETPPRPQPEVLEPRPQQPSFVNQAREAMAYLRNYMDRANQTYRDALALLRNDAFPSDATDVPLSVRNTRPETPPAVESPSLTPSVVEDPVLVSPNGDISPPRLEPSPQQPVAGQQDGPLPLLERPEVPVEVPVASEPKTAPPVQRVSETPVDPREVAEEIRKGLRAGIDGVSPTAPVPQPAPAVVAPKSQAPNAEVLAARRELENAQKELEAARAAQEAAQKKTNDTALDPSRIQSLSSQATGYANTAVAETRKAIAAYNRSSYGDALTYQGRAVAAQQGAEQRLAQFISSARSLRQAFAAREHRVNIDAEINIIAANPQRLAAIKASGGSYENQLNQAIAQKQTVERAIRSIVTKFETAQKQVAESASSGRVADAERRVRRAENALAAIERKAADERTQVIPASLQVPRPAPRPIARSTEPEQLEQDRGIQTPLEPEGVLVRPGSTVVPQPPVAPQQPAAGQADGPLPLGEKQVSKPVPEDPRLPDESQKAVLPQRNKDDGVPASRLEDTPPVGDLEGSVQKGLVGEFERAGTLLASGRFADNAEGVRILERAQNQQIVRAINATGDARFQQDVIEYVANGKRDEAAAAVTRNAEELRVNISRGTVNEQDIELLSDSWFRRFLDRKEIQADFATFATYARERVELEKQLLALEDTVRTRQPLVDTAAKRIPELRRAELIPSDSGRSVSSPRQNEGLASTLFKDVSKAESPSPNLVDEVGRPELVPSDNIRVSRRADDRLSSLLLKDLPNTSNHIPVPRDGAFSAPARAPKPTIPPPQEPTPPVAPKSPAPAPSPRVTQGTTPPSNGDVPTPPQPPRVPPAYIGDPPGPGVPPPSLIRQSPLLSLWWLRMAAVLNQSSEDEERRRNAPQLPQLAPRTTLGAATIPTPIPMPGVRDIAYVDRRVAGGEGRTRTAPPTLTPDGEPELVESIREHKLDKETCEKDPELCKAAESTGKKEENDDRTIVGEGGMKGVTTSVAPPKPSGEKTETPNASAPRPGSKDPSTGDGTQRPDAKTPGSGGQRIPGTGGQGTGGGGGNTGGGGDTGAGGNGSSASGSGSGIGGFLANLLGLVKSLSNYFPELGCFLNPSQPQCPTPAQPTPVPTTPTPAPVPSATSTPPAPQGTGSVTLIAVPSEVGTGKISILRWSSTNTSSCNIYHSDKTLLASGNVRGEVLTPRLSTSTTFIAECRDANREQISRSSVTVRVSSGAVDN